MQTSPRSMGVRPAKSLLTVLAGDPQSVRMPSWTARVAMLLSMPKTTSPKGESLVRISWLTRLVPSPGVT